MVQTVNGLGRIMVSRWGFYRVGCCDHTLRAFTTGRNIAQFRTADKTSGIVLIVQKRNCSRVTALKSQLKGLVAHRVRIHLRTVKSSNRLLPRKRLEFIIPNAVLDRAGTGVAIRLG
jgi:hypothetical protein